MDKKVVIVTHDGMFHADDVFAVAALLCLLDTAPVVATIARTRDEDVIRKADFAVDVGSVYDAEKNRFDHHQIGGAGKRTNDLPAAHGLLERGSQSGAAGIPYAAFGLVWQKFGTGIAGSETAAAIVDQRLVATIDAKDCGVDLFDKKFKNIEPYDIDEFVHNLRPTWQEDASKIDAKFLEAVAFGRKVIEREVVHAKAAVAAEAIIRKAYEAARDKRIIILDAYYSFEKVLGAFPEPLFAVYPRLDGAWTAKAIRDDISSFKNRKDFPKTWVGLRDLELVKVSGVPDATFCHNGRFMAVARSREGALALAQKALMS